MLSGCFAAFWYLLIPITAFLIDTLVEADLNRGYRSIGIGIFGLRFNAIDGAEGDADLATGAMSLHDHGENLRFLFLLSDAFRKIREI